MTKSFDVVVVPDFSGKNSPVFEARTLFFLASWLDNVNCAQAFPLHLACIGQPPASVRWIAKRCGAFVTIHQPVGAEGRGFSNKLRGLEIQGHTDHVLLMDIDVLPLGDLSGLTELGSCIAAAPGIFPRVPDNYWRKIYDALNMELPTVRIASLRGELNCSTLGSGQQFYSEQNAEVQAMFPYYNGGIVFAPRNCDLRNLWEENIRRIIALFDNHEHEKEGLRRAIGDSDQAGLAVTIEQLKHQGVPFKRLPNAFHSNWLHLYRRTVPLHDTKLFHAFHILEKVTSSTTDLDAEIDRFYRHLRRRLTFEWQANDHKRLDAFLRYRRPSVTDARKLQQKLQRLHKDYVVPALRQTQSPQ